MSRRILSCLAAISLLAGCSIAHAQGVAVEVNGTGITGSPFASGSTVTINLDPVNSDTDIHIYDTDTSSTVPSRSIGKITINGTLGASGAQLRVLVAASGQSFPIIQTTGFLAEGLVNFGSSSSDGLEVTNSALRANTRLAMAVSGDVNGTIDVGQVFRLQADGVFTGSPATHVSGGNINATIIARLQDEQFPTAGFASIEYVRAGWSITPVSFPSV